MTKTLSVYLPQDRYQALLRGSELPDHTTGSALFADISGFTPLTEKLTRQLGERRGIEELTRRINEIYDALIRLVELQGGSVISFAGDAITCWFDMSDENPSLRAITAALAMQAAMSSFENIFIKVAVTTGPSCRFVVGDPQIQLLDTLAGETVARLATAEHLAQQGEVITDVATLQACGEGLQVGKWRYDPDTAERFALIEAFPIQLEATPYSPLENELPPDLLQKWVLPNVYTREQSELGEFLTELRPAAVLFLRFSGIDYDGDSASQQKLDALIQQVQQVVGRFDGTLLQLTIGDKGSYLYACFGAPTAYEDDARRAVMAALALRELPLKLPFLQPIQIGISRGILRVGAYGGASRRTYGALGDEVNLAARLMSIAAPGEILITARIRSSIGEQYLLEPHLPIMVKGKSEAVSVFGVKEASRQHATRLLEPIYQLPMVGRQDELALITRKLELARQGQGQIIGITAEAGLGKSRLVAEVIRLARLQGFGGYGGACESSGTNTPYLVWKAVWKAFFEADSRVALTEQVRQLESKLETLAPQRMQALPLLGPLIDVSLEDNDFTRTLEPKERRNTLTALLEDCLKAGSKEEPLLIVLEDVHWMDPLSHDLLLALGRAIVNSAVCFVLAYRPIDLERLQAPQVEALPHFSRVGLSELDPAEAEQLIQAKVAQIFPLSEANPPLPERLLKQMTSKGQGNPFFLEELLNYLRDRNISPYDEIAFRTLELPSSLHTLILSRIDQLSEGQKVTLKVASIIGRLFPFNWLYGYYPNLGTPEAVKADLSVLARLDITPLDTPEPNLAYLFKHIVTQEVAYESLVYTMRTQLHEQLGQYLEGLGEGQYLDLLAYHFGKSENQAKQREYFEKAGDTARVAYANEAALDYYERLLPLLSEPTDQIDIYLKLATVLHLISRYQDGEKYLNKALLLATADVVRQTRIQKMLGSLNQNRGDYPTALGWLEKARVNAEKSGDKVELGQVLFKTGQVLFQKGDFDPAQEVLEVGLALGQEIEDKKTIANALRTLGSVAAYQGDYQTARERYEASLPLMNELGDKLGLSSLYNNMGNVAYSQSDYQLALTRYEASLVLARQIGDKWNIAIVLSNLGLINTKQGNYAVARKLIEESLLIRREMNNKWGIAISLSYLGSLLLNMDELDEATAFLEESLKLSREMDDKTSIILALYNLGCLSQLQGNYSQAEAYNEESLALARKVNDPQSIAQALLNQGNVSYAQENYNKVRTFYEECLTIRLGLGVKDGILDTLAGLAKIVYREGNSTRFVQLIAVVETLRRLYNFSSDQADLPRYKTELIEAKMALGEEAYQAAYEAGQKLSLEEATRLALEK